MKLLDLNILTDGISTGLSVYNGGFLAEAASLCLDHNKHQLETAFQVGGHYTGSYQLKRLGITPAITGSYADTQEAIEYGACGIAIVLLNHETSWKVKRAWKGDGFDYWLGEENEDYPFQNKSRLEISGILKGTQGQISSRLKEKMEQTTVSDHMTIPAYACVVEFGDPRSLTGKR
jgi:hypothetical protein